jgi:hypothetical protein
MDEEMCDEEKYYHEWVKNNPNYLVQNKLCISVMKKVYMAGFGDGFSYKLKHNTEEHLQK